MKPLSGVISDKIRSIFKPGDPALNPPRPNSPTKSSDISSKVSGRPLKGRDRRS